MGNRNSHYRDPRYTKAFASLGQRVSQRLALNNQKKDEILEMRKKYKYYRLPPSEIQPGDDIILNWIFYCEKCSILIHKIPIIDYNLGTWDTVFQIDSHNDWCFNCMDFTRWYKPGNQLAQQYVDQKMVKYECETNFVHYGQCGPPGTSPCARQRYDYDYVGPFTRKYKHW